MARVEIPAWFATDKKRLDVLQATLVRQARISGNGYPYVLARAHEEAVISQAEREVVEEMIAVTMLRHGLKPALSPKQAHKNLLTQSSNQT